MPVAAQVRSLIRDHHEMEGAGGDRRFTSRADVGLAGSVWLDGCDRHLEVPPPEHGHPPKKPHATRATVTATAVTRRATSMIPLFCSRNGLKPMRTTVDGVAADPGRAGYRHGPRAGCRARTRVRSAG